MTSPSVRREQEVPDQEEFRDGALMPTGPIYIGGLDRCGKTTLRAFLASHSRIAIPTVGTNMWTYFYGQYGDLARRENLDRCLDAMLRYTHVTILKPDPERIRAEFALGPRTYAHLFSLFLKHYAELERKPRWGAQTGLIERYADHLFAAYPGLKIIHMVRDPRDRYEASLARWPNGKGRAGGATARWRYSIRLAERHLRRYPNDYMILRFEELVRETEKTLRSVCGFLGEEYEASMLTMDGAHKHRSLLTEIGVSSEGPILSTDFIGGYRGRIPRAELAFMQLHAGRLMRKYGYEPDVLEFDTREWLAFSFASWPDQAARYATWRIIEEIQQRFPERAGRTPGRRLILDEPYEPAR